VVVGIQLTRGPGPTPKRVGEEPARVPALRICSSGRRRGRTVHYGMGSRQRTENAGRIPRGVVAALSPASIIDYSHCAVGIFVEIGIGVANTLGRDIRPKLRRSERPGEPPDRRRRCPGRDRSVRLRTWRRWPTSTYPAGNCSGTGEEFGPHCC
jgi:hypothetical protein